MKRSGLCQKESRGLPNRAIRGGLVQERKSGRGSTQDGVQEIPKSSIKQMRGKEKKNENGPGEKGAYTDSKHKRVTCKTIFFGSAHLRKERGDDLTGKK